MEWAVQGTGYSLRAASGTLLRYGVWVWIGLSGRCGSLLTEDIQCFYDSIVKNALDTDRSKGFAHLLST